MTDQDAQLQAQTVSYYPYKKRLFFIFLILIGISLALGALFTFRSSSKNNDVAEENNNLKNAPTVPSYNQSTSSQKEYEPLTVFQVNYLSAELPAGWTMKEYTDIAGMHESLTQTLVVSGLSGFEIFDESSHKIYEVKGLSGVGGTSGCSELSVFKDTSEDYIQQIEEENSYFLPPLKLNIVDLTQTNYSEINMLGLRMGRVSNSIYLAVKKDSNNFNTTCGTSSQYYVFDDLFYTIKDAETEFKSNIYFAKLNTEVNWEEDKLAKLDKILNSLKIKQ